MEKTLLPHAGGFSVCVLGQGDSREGTEGHRHESC